MFGKPSRRLRKRLERDGTQVAAVVVAIAKRGMSTQPNRSDPGSAVAILKTSLRIQSPDGSAAFEVSKRFRFSTFAIPRVGDIVTVWFDPNDHGKVILHRSGSTASAVATDPLDRLAKLTALRDQGALTVQEFDEQKAKILRDV